MCVGFVGIMIENKNDRTTTEPNAIKNGTVKECVITSDGNKNECIIPFKMEE